MRRSRASWTQIATAIVAVQFFAMLAPSSARAQGALTNGGQDDGTISVPGEQDEWIFTAAANDTIVVRIGELSDATGTFNPRIQILDPSNVSYGPASGVLAAELTLTAPSAGTYRVVVADANNNDTASYRLSLAKVPGAFVVVDGDGGGPLLSGAVNEGTITVGDLDMWSFATGVNETVVIRIGEVIDNNGAFTPSFRLYGPAGALVGFPNPVASSANEVTLTNSVAGTYTVVVGDASQNLDGIDDTGDYRLHIAKTQGPFIVGDEGGNLLPPGGYGGNSDVGDLDMWSFCAGAGDAIVARVDEYSDLNGHFDPGVRLYGPAGNLLDLDVRAASAQVSVNATVSGTYTLIVGDGNVNLDGIDDPGAYTLSISGTNGCAFTCVPPAAGLVSWWPAEGSPADAQDGNVGAMQNGAAFDQGRIGQGFRFIDGDDFVNIPDSGNLNLTSAFTWDAWIDPYAFYDDPVIMSKELSASNRTGLKLLTTGSLCGYFDDFVTCSPPHIVPPSQFSHVAMVFDDVTGQMRLYVNSVPVATGTGAGRPAGNSAPLTIGATANEGHFFAGIIDEVDVFGRALADSEIFAIFNAGTEGKCTLCPRPPACDDGNECTTDGCHAATGECTHTNRAGSCEEGNACTTGDTCVDGTCVGGPPAVCDDSNPCSDDSCEAPGGCVHVPNIEPCDDGNPCTTSDMCQFGNCAGGIPVDCEDGLDCTLDTCDTGSGLCTRYTYPVQEVPEVTFATNLTLEWMATADATHWNTYRGTIPARGLGSRLPASVYDHLCWESDDSHGDGATLATDASAPPMGTAYYYDITAESACTEGPLGADSSGTFRPKPFPCPTPP